MRLSAEDLLHHPWFKQMEAEEKKNQEESEWVKQENESSAQEAVTIVPDETAMDVEKPVILDEPKEMEVQEYKESREYTPKELGNETPSEEVKKEQGETNEDFESKQSEDKHSIENPEVKPRPESDLDGKTVSQSIDSPKQIVQPSPDPADDEWIGVSPPPNLTPLVFPTSMK